MLVNVGEPIHPDEDAGTGFVGSILPRAGGGFSVFQSSWNYDPATGTTTRAESVRHFDATSTSVTPVGEPVELGSTHFGNVHARDDGSYLVSIDESTTRVDETGVHVDGKIALATMSAAGRLATFYTATLGTVDGSDGDADAGVAYGASGSIALARIAEAATGSRRVVDLVGTDHVRTATVVVDRDTTGDQGGSTGVLALSDGRFLVTWVEEDADGADLMARVVTAAGKVAGAAFVIGHADDLPTPADVGLRYQMTALAEGNFAVAFEASEDYFNPSNPFDHQQARTPVEATTWVANGRGVFSHGTDLVQDEGLSRPSLQSLITLSTGQILEVVHESRDLAEGVSLGTLHGYLYDRNGEATGDSFAFYSEASAFNYFEDGARAVALDDGRFAFVKSEYVIGANALDAGDVIQIFSTTAADFVSVGGASAGGDILKGAVSSARADLIDGLGGNDRLYGYAGNDKLVGGTGNDLLDGGKGADRMEGGAGDDVYVVDNMGDKVVEGRGKGIDLVKASVSYTFADNVDGLLLTGSDDIRGFGNDLANTLTGNAGRNLLYGLGGNDVLNGGAKADILNGGAGKDTFVFDARIGASNVDRILDFATADDTIGLDGAIFEGLAAGRLKSAAFKDTANGPVDGNDRILYDHKTGALSYDADGSGTAKAVQFAVIENHALLTYADIVIV